MSNPQLPLDTRAAVPESGAPTGSPVQDTSPSVQFEPFDAETVMNTLLEGLPEPTTARRWRDDLQHMPEGSADSCWQNCFKVVEKHDKDLCQAYREQIDTLLVFAGLFSAVVTAFAVESYQWLQDDPADTSVVLLRDMMQFMAQTSNRTLEPAPLKPPRLSDDVVVRINVFWFVSLCLSLSAALVGILSKQWLREYERDVGRSPEKALAVRHIKFQGLEYWKVGTIVTSVPIILQIALALFLLGIVDLLWRLHAAVAGCVTAVAGLTLAFYLFTTFLPVIQYAYICLRCCSAAGPMDAYCRAKAFAAPQCAFKSAQAWIAVLVAQPVIEHCIKAYARCFACYLPPDLYPLELPRADSWVRFDINWTRRREYLYRGPHAAYEALSWAARCLDEADLSSWIWHCVWSRRQGGLGIVDDAVSAASDISCVADAYPRLVSPGSSFPVNVRAQCLVFRCSLRADLPADATIEQLLRIAFVVGVNSQWTRDALNAVVALYDERAVHLSDDVAMGLLDLAELQSIDQWEINTQIAAEDRNPHIPFLQIARLINRGSRLHGRLLPAMCALAVPWLGVQSRELVQPMAQNLLRLVLDHYINIGYDHRRLLGSPGVLLVARFAHITSRFWPDFHTWCTYRSEHRALLSMLLSIWSSRDENAASVSEDPPAVSAGVRTGAPGELGSNSRDDVRITVHEAQSATVEANLTAVTNHTAGPAPAS